MTVKNYLAEQLELSYLNLAVSDWKEKHLDEYYDIDTRRETMSPALARTRAYNLRRPAMPSEQIVKTESTQNCLEFADTGLAADFKSLMYWVQRIGWEVHGPRGWEMLGRVFVSRLEPGAVIKPHIDEGAYFDTLHRYHLVLESEGSKFLWKGHEITMRQGELWRVNNSVMHWVENTNTYRTHLIFDAL